MRDDVKRNLRVGGFTLLALAVLGVAIITIGNRQQLFIRHTRYRTTFANVTGLQNGAPVTLNGVTVGFVERIELPVDPDQQRIVVRFTLDTRFTERIREDTRVSIKTIGLLGDKYLELRGGSAEAERILEGGLVRGKDPAAVEEFVASGEDLMENLLAISSSLKTILRRVEAGEGFLGEMVTAPASGARMSDTLNSALESLSSVLASVDAGEGLLGRLVRDDDAGERILVEVEGSARAVRSAASALATDLEREDTAYAALVKDPEGARLVMESLDAMRQGTQALAAAAEELATGEGTLPRLMADGEYADEFLEDLAELIDALRSTAEKLDRGDGTAGAFINDEQMYQDLENVVRGVKNSKVVSWFIRNRRKSGEKSQAKEAEEAAEQAAAEAQAGDTPGG